MEAFRKLNWRILSGAEALDVVSDYTTLVLADPTAEVYNCYGLDFGDMLDISVRNMCEAYRRLYLNSKRLDMQLLGIYYMDLAQAREFLRTTSSRSFCCGGHSLTQVAWFHFVLWSCS